jgi:hypothetical protein
MTRKTVSVEFLKDKANTFLRTSADEMVGERYGISALLESALFESNNYKGFKYLASEFDDHDETRRMYF